MRAMWQGETRKEKIGKSGTFGRRKGARGEKEADGVQDRQAAGSAGGRARRRTLRAEDGRKRRRAENGGEKKKHKYRALQGTR